MACDEQPPLAARLRDGMKQRHSLEQRIDAGIAGDVGGPDYTLSAEVGRVQRGGSEQQFGQAIDGDAEVFLRRS
jgi:hypothetical protein